MPVYSNIKSVRSLTNASLTSIVDITNLNFNSLASGILTFLGNIKYDESLNSISLSEGTFNVVNISDSLNIKLDGITTFSIDSLGRAEGQELLVKVAESQRLRFTDFNDWPDVGVPGEIIYTGIQNQKAEFGEDFIGYLQGRGWVSLTGLGQNYITLTQISGSPAIPPIPGPNRGTLWIGPQGFETAYEAATQTVYYTDEYGNIFDILSDFIWLINNDDAIFKLPGKLIIGEVGDEKSLQYVDGNQQAGYVLTCDQDGNASWQPINIGGGSSCSYVTVQGFTANVPLTITHNLNSNNIVIQLIDTSTNEYIEAYYDNYQLNTVDITLTQTLPTVKVIIISGDCDKPSGNKKYIRPGDIITNYADYQYFIYGNLTVEGTFENYGEVVIANGTINLVGPGSYSNLGAGTTTYVNLSTGDNISVDIQNFVAVAGVPLLITHNLGTTDFVYNVYDGTSFVDVALEHIDSNNVQLTSTGNINNGVIVFHAKI